MSRAWINNWILLEMEIKSLRKSWPWVMGLSCLYPLSLLFFLKFLGSAMSSAVYVLSGGLVFSLTLTTTLALGQEISDLRENSSLDFFAALPVSQVQIAYSILLRAVILSLPAVLLIGLIGVFLLGLKPALGWFAMVPVLVLSSASLAGVGALIGFKSPSTRFANLATQAFYLIVVFFSPIMFPVSNLPPALRPLSWALPTTYAAEALRCILAGGFVSARDLLALAGFAVLSSYVLRRQLRRP